jgi:hypothetical protein
MRRPGYHRTEPYIFFHITHELFERKVDVVVVVSCCCCCGKHFSIYMQMNIRIFSVVKRCPVVYKKRSEGNKLRFPTIQCL